ncbi:hypothetical protein Tco_0866359 [Tanacetum coccineum]
MDSGSSCEVIYEHCFMKFKPSIRASNVDSKVPLIGFSGEKSWSIEKIPLEITIGDAPLTKKETLDFMIVKSDLPYNMLLGRTTMLRDLLRANTDVFAWTHADMIGIARTITVKGKPFNTEHGLNEYSHVKPIKKKRRGLGPDRSTIACKEVEELTKVGILRKVKHQTWVANPVMTPTRVITRLKWHKEMKIRRPSSQKKGSSVTKDSFGFKGCWRKLPKIVDKVFHARIREKTLRHLLMSGIKSPFEKKCWQILRRLLRSCQSNQHVKLNAEENVPSGCKRGRSFL